jgi:L-seryl-tRNA(Ser) seleniumtransferase
LPTWCLAVRPQGRSVDQFAKELRNGTPAVVGRVQRDCLWLDMRTVFPRQDQGLVEAFRQLGTKEDAGTKSESN